jgi:peptide/nickel transport system substrate-binding protein
VTRSMNPRPFLVAAALALAAAGCSFGGDDEEQSATSTQAGAKGGTLITIAQGAPAGSPDPQINYTLQEWQFLIVTHDGLLGFKRVGGAGGTKLVPDLAESIPKPQDGGKTYTFTLRQNIKYSNGAVVKASDFVSSYERIFKVASPNAGTWYNVVVGADACLKQAKTCDLSKGIVADDAARTVTYHLTSADPEFLFKMAVPFAFVLPPDTPDKEVQMPPPGTGPYTFVEYNSRKQMKLVRNTFFKEWSKDAQPAGNPDVIVQKFGLTPESQVTQVENGQADWMFDNPPTDRLPEMSEKYAEQVHINPLTAVWYMAFNVKEKPFDNVKARQAVNFATDHNALVKVYGGPKLAVPTCQILPPRFPGYKPYCPYTANPGGGKWTAPDMAKAQQLVDESGTKGAKVKVTVDNTTVPKAIGSYFVSLLNQLGYKATLQALSPDLTYPYCQNSKNHVQFCYSSWYQDYPAASDFINILLGCGSVSPGSNASPNIAEYCVPKVESQIQAALKKGLTDPESANEDWAKVDQQIVDDAPWVPMFNPKYIDFLSKRVTGYQFSPQWYFLLAQASVQ